MTAIFQSAGDLFDGWRDDVLAGSAPVLFPIGAGDLGRIEIGPGLVTLFGGAPGAGKTSFTMQAVVDALRLTPTLRAMVCNMPANGRIRTTCRRCGSFIGYRTAKAKWMPSRKPLKTNDLRSRTRVDATPSEVTRAYTSKEHKQNS